MNKISRTCPKSPIKVDKIGRISNYSNNKQQIRKQLIEMSSNLCAYCNCWLKVTEYTPHIEHYKPKEKFPNLEIVWHNLFASCPKCNEIKGSKFPDIEPLKPDKENYHFDYWFKIDFETNFIKPNKLRNLEEQEIAQKTIDWLGLNDNDRPEARFDELEKYNSSDIKDVNKWSYPFFLERGKN